MIGEKDGNECAHAGCRCPVAEEGDFCGEECEEGEAEGETDCGCGHPECRAQA